MVETIKISYEDLILKINHKIIKQVKFSLKGYAHYKCCTLYWTKQNIINKAEIDRLILCMTQDKTEIFSFFHKYPEEYKLFKIKGRGTFTLRQLWDNVEIKSIEYFNNR